MKGKLFLLWLFLFSVGIDAQVKIGNNPNSIDSSSILELESVEKVLVITRVTTLEMNAISPLNGALVYNTDVDCVFQFNGSVWESLCDSVNQAITAIVDNDDGTFTFTDENGDQTIIDITNLETLTTLEDNDNGTITYTDEDGNTTVINFANIINNFETVTVADFDQNTGLLTYTDENGDVFSLNLLDLIANNETLTILEDNGDGRRWKSYDY